MSIISKKTADELVKNGDAEYSGEAYDNGKRYLIITRFDIQDVDHVFVGWEEQPTNPMT